VLVLIAYFFIDKPVVYALYRGKESGINLLNFFIALSSLFSAIVLFLYTYYLFKFAYQKITRFDRVLLAIANSVAITSYSKDLFKFVFGRYWPKTWSLDNSSLLQNKAYGFNFFHGGMLNTAFPSGHAAVITAAMSVLWLCYPKYRWLYATTVLLVAIGLIGLNYHFVSDVIAGCFLGGLIGYYVTIVSRLIPQ
jgi:membrane-associated phospholipid phosphatase